MRQRGRTTPEQGDGEQGEAGDPEHPRTHGRRHERDPLLLEILLESLDFALGRSQGLLRRDRAGEIVDAAVGLVGDDTEAEPNARGDEACRGQLAAIDPR